MTPAERIIKIRIHLDAIDRTVRKLAEMQHSDQATDAALSYIADGLDHVAMAIREASALLAAAAEREVR